MSTVLRTHHRTARWRTHTGRLALAGTMAAAVTVMLAQSVQASTTPPVSTLSWHLLSPVDPTGSIGDDLSDVSCTSPTACTTVGSFESLNGSSSVFTTFAERWNGSTWTIQNTPAATESNLSGVTCVTATHCVAVGDVLTGTGINTAPLAEVWNGSTWSIQGTPNPAGATRAFLVDVDCTAANQCTAVGSYSKKSGKTFPLAERWNGSNWKLQTTPQPTGSTSTEFNGVSCGSATSCIAAGDTNVIGAAIVAEVWNGTSWTVDSPADPSNGGFLGGVSCTAANACTAAGDYFNGSAQVSLAERWDGTSWTQQTTANAAGATETELDSVSCSATSQCVAAGSARSHGHTRTKAEHWNGSKWSLQNVGAPAGSIESALSGVSCPTTTDCIAVGFWEDSTGTSFVLAAEYS